MTIEETIKAVASSIEWELSRAGFRYAIDGPVQSAYPIIERELLKHFGQPAPELCCLGSIATSQADRGFGDDLHCVRHDEWSRGADRDDEKIEMRMADPSADEQESR